VTTQQLTTRRGAADLLAWLAGGRADVMADVPGSRGKHATMGGVLMSTAVMASVSASFALHMAVGATMALAVTCGLSWGLVILTLDRMLVLGMGQERSLRRNLGVAAPRLVLAFILGTVISTPLTLQIFQKEIQTQLAVDQQATKDAYQRQIATDPALSQIPGLRQRVADEQKVIATGGGVDPTKDPTVVAAQSDVDAKQTIYGREAATYQRLDAAAQCELNGTCGTHVEGTGTAYRQARASADAQFKVMTRAKQDLDAATTALSTARTQAGTTASGQASRTVAETTANLAADQKKLTALVTQQDQLTREYDATAAADDGLLARLQALSGLGEKRPVLHLAQLLLAALFLCIELLPVLMKLLINVGEPSTYDRELKVREEGQVRISELRHDGHLKSEQVRVSIDVQAEQARAASALAVEKERCAQQEKVQTVVNAAVAEHQERIITEALRIWGQHAMRQAKQQLADYEARLAGTTGWTGTGVGQPTTPPVTGTNGVRISTFTPAGTAANGRPNKYIHGAALPDIDDI
jgi:Domain of unknown function (DUF4407)